MTRPESTQTHIGPFLRFVRHQLGLTLRQAANVTHVNFTYLAQVERGDKTPSDSWLNAYVTGLGVSLADRDAGEAA